MRLWPKRTAMLLVTIASLLVSAVSACACSHHQQVAADARVESCHSSSQASMNMPDTDPLRVADSDLIAGSIDENCDCPVRIQLPAVFSNQDKPQHITAKKPVPSGPVVVEMASVILDPLPTPPDTPATGLFLSSRPFRSISPRAPPRL